jgi:nucleoid-associated protein YgaU
MSISYNKNTYNSVISAKIENENAINDIYASFDNFTQDEKFAALEIVDSLQIINEEFNKYIAAYNTIIQNESQVNEYIVTANDSIFGIAQRETGDYNNWKQIMRFNKLTDIDIEVGTTILIPQNI